MKDDFHEDKLGSSRKLKRLDNKRERLQVKHNLKGSSPEDFINDELWNEDEDDIENEILYKN